MAIILLADSGSTKTEWCLLLPDQQPQRCLTDGLNPYFLTTEQIQQTIRQQLLSQFPDLGTLPVDNVFFYGTGCVGLEANSRVEQAIRQAVPAVVSVAVASDMLGAARSVAGSEPGIVGILGTGSNVCYFDGDQIVSPSYALGFWLGDEGSGGNLGKRLVTAFLHGLFPPDLLAAFASQYHLDRIQVLDHAYKQPNPNRYFASFAPFLSQHLAHPFVLALVTDAFTQFIHLYVRRMPLAETNTLHLIGSVAYHFQPVLADVLRQQHLQLGRVLQAPMQGLIDYHRPGGKLPVRTDC